MATIATSEFLLESQLLVEAGRLLLEYNESTAVIHDALEATAKALTDAPCHVAITYLGVSVAVGQFTLQSRPVSELRFNTAVQARVHAILAQARHKDLGVADALTHLERVESETRKYPRWLVAILLGTAAVSLAGLLGADYGAVASAGIATLLGFLARQALARWHFSRLALPLIAAFIGSVLGGIAIRLGWTETPQLALVVPSLMLVPGPHIINGFLDLIDNYLPMCLSRLGLATGITLASALGIALGVEVALPGPLFPEPSAHNGHLNLFSDMAFAGIVTCGFAVFYNTAWRHVGMAVIGGMASHGIRFLALQAGCRVEAATFFGGLSVGAISALMAHSAKTPVAVIAFAGAVTMIPGVNLYSAMAGALQIARSPHSAGLELISVTSGASIQAGVIVAGLVLGLILGARLIQTILKDFSDRPA
jgi:uncharacterized membrane protein YjjP (DUF1212 family)